MLASSRLFNALKFAAPLVIIFWCIAYFTTSPSTYTEVLRQFKDDKQLFITDFLQHEIDGQFDGSSIADLCKRQTWTPDLYLSCESPAGGVGMVKNAHLNCIRFAIEMGAELILPGIVPRSTKDIAVIAPEAKAPIRGNEMDYFFDVDHLNRSLATYCPQMRIYRSLNDLYQIPSLLTAYTFSLADLVIPLVNTTMIQHPSQVGTYLKTFVGLKSPADERKHPVRFHLHVTNFAWPTAADGAQFARHFGRILRIRTDARRLAAMALFNMQKRFHLTLDPRKGLQNDSFVGVHLRTEKDVAGKEEWPEYEEQAAYYLDYAVASKSPVIFLATGASERNVTAFVSRARDFNITTVLKADILNAPEEKTMLAEFNYDQRALVDYEIMLRAGLMTGTSESPFAWNLAMRRRNAYSEPAAPVTVPARLAGRVQWKDAFSTIFGTSEYGKVMAATIWP